LAKRITFTVDERIHKKIKLKTIKNNTTIRDVATCLMTNYLKEGDDVRLVQKKGEKANGNL
jgi:hypothetical protein